MQLVSPLAELLGQWLLLPLFADIGMAVLLVRSTRGRVGLCLVAILSVLALRNVAAIIPWEGPDMVLDSIGAALLPSLVLLFVLSDTGGRSLASVQSHLSMLVLGSGLAVALATLLLGWKTSHPALLGFAAVNYGLVVALFYTSYGEPGHTGREPALIGAALTLLIVSGPVFDLLQLGSVPLPLFPYSSAAAGALLCFVVLRFMPYSIAPASEEGNPGEAGLPTQPGLYMASPSRPYEARELFAKAVRHGVPGLAVSRTHPAAFRRQTGLWRVPVLWLAQSAYERSLRPGEPEILSHTLRDYAIHCDRSAILLEDLDYVVTNSGLFETYDLLGELKKTAETSGLFLLMTSELLTAEERRMLTELGIDPLSLAERPRAGQSLDS